MDYAAAASRNRPTLQGQRPAAAVNPLRHLSHLQGLSLLVDLKTVRPTHTKVERADFVLKDLGIPAQEVLSIFVDHVTQLLILTIESEEVFNTALERLHGGVPWAAAEGAEVFGSSSSEAVSAVRVSNIPHGLPIPAVLSHMQQFGTILNHNMGRDRLFPRATDGILHLTMVLHEAENLPHFIQVVDSNGRLSNSLPVHMDSPRRRCYRCGRPSHLGYRCQATTRAPDAPASIWSTLVAPPPPGNSLNSVSRATNISQATRVDPEPDRVDRSEAPSQKASVSSSPSSNTQNIVESSQDKAVTKGSPSSTDQPASEARGGLVGGHKRPLASLPPSSSSERERSTSPKSSQSDSEFAVVKRGRRSRGKNRRLLESTEVADESELFKKPQSVPAIPKSSLEDIVLTPRMEEGDDSDGGESE